MRMLLIAIHPGLRLSLVAVVVCLLATVGTAGAQARPYRDPDSGLWGYRTPAGVLVIGPRFLGVGEFSGGRAPVQDAAGFAMIDSIGSVVERIRTDTLVGTSVPIPPPAERCNWRSWDEFPSSGLQCYAAQLGLDSTATGGLVRLTSARGEGSRAVLILRAESGAVLFEQHAYEGFSRMIALPDTPLDSVEAWSRRLYAGRPKGVGCSESWTSGSASGGSFITQRAGC